MGIALALRNRYVCPQVQRIGEKLFPGRKADNLRYLVKSLILFVAGCMLIVMVTPFIRLARAQSMLNTALTLKQRGDCATAMDILQRFETWTLRNDGLDLQYRLELIRCYMKLGKMNMAMYEAERVKNSHRPNPPPRFPGSMPEIRDYLFDGPDWVANKIIGATSGNLSRWDDGAGFGVVITELQTTGDVDELKKYAGIILAADSGNQEAKAALAFIERANMIENHKEDERAQARERKLKLATRAQAVQPSPSVVVAKPEIVAPPPSVQPAQKASEEARRQKEAGLRAKEARLTASIEARKSILNNKYPVHQAGQIGAKYDALRARSSKLEAEMNKATGQRRIDIMEELRPMKGEMARCQAELDQAEAAITDAENKRANALNNDQELRSLEGNLAKVRNDLENL